MASATTLGSPAAPPSSGGSPDDEVHRRTIAAISGAVAVMNLSYAFFGIGLGGEPHTAAWLHRFVSYSSERKTSERIRSNSRHDSVRCRAVPSLLRQKRHSASSFNVCLCRLHAEIRSYRIMQRLVAAAIASVLKNRGGWVSADSGPTLPSGVTTDLSGAPQRWPIRADRLNVSIAFRRALAVLLDTTGLIWSLLSSSNSSSD